MKMWNGCLEATAEMEYKEVIKATVKAKSVNGKVQLQALVDGKKVIITKSTIRRDLQLKDAEGVDCLPNVSIFEQLTLIGFVQVFLNNELEGMSNHNRIYVTLSHTKKIFGNMRRVGKDFSERETSLFPTMMVQAREKMGEEHVADEAVNEEINDSLERGSTTATSLDAEQDKGNIFKTQSKETPNEPGSQGTSLGGGPRCQKTMRDTVAQTRSERVSKISNDPLLAGVNTPRSGEDSLKLNELMELCTKLQQRVLDLETTKTTQALEIDSLKRKVKKLERERDGDEVIVESVDVSKQAKEVVDDITLAKALMEIKSAKPKADKVVIQEPEQGTTTTTPTTITAVSSKPKAKGLVIHKQDQAPTPTVSSQQASHRKEKSSLLLKELKKRNRPPTRAQQRSIMCTYLKNMEGWKPKSLKNKSFDNIQELFDKAKKRVNIFVDYRTELIVESSKKAKIEVTEGSSKRAGKELEQENVKKQKIDDVKETFELKQEDVETLWKLVKAKHGSTRLEEGYERVLWGDLKVMFDPHVEDEVWKLQQIYSVVKWTLFNSCGVHCLSLQFGHIYMLVEKRCPLTPDIITDMLNKKLHADNFDEMTYQLLKLVTK
nr:hypothetical protein [Tanacetum cinerariifolium]